MKRFYKATDGRITVYRGTETREYRSATFGSHYLTPADGVDISSAGWYRKGSLGFSASTPGGSRAAWGGWHATEEITQSEYETLIATRNTWLQARGIDLRDRTSPQESWLPNAMLSKQPQGWDRIEAGSEGE